MAGKKRTRILIKIISLTIALGGILYTISYIKNITLPVKIKELVIENIKKETGKKAHIKDVRFMPFKGTTIEGLTIYDEEGTLLEAGRISFNYLTGPLFQKKIIIPSLGIDDLSLTIKNDPETGLWNISKFPCFEKGRGASLARSYPLIVRRVTLNNLDLRLIDNTRSPALSKRIKNGHINIIFNPKSAGFKASADLEQKQKDLALGITGYCSYKKRVLDVTLNLGVEDENFLVKGSVENFTSPTVKFSVSNDDYMLSGTLRDFDNPEVDLSLKSDETSANTSFTITDKDLKIKTARINHKGSSASFSGDVYGIDSPEVNIYGELDLLLEDLIPLIPDGGKQFEGLGISGRCKGEVFIGGNPASPHLLEAGLKLKSDKVKMQKCVFRDIEARLAAKNGKASLTKLDADLYGGRLEITSELGLKKDLTAYNVTGHLRGLKIEEIAAGTDLKDAGIYGNVDSSVNISGIWKDPSTVKGEGWLHAKDAHLGPLPVFIPVVTSIVDFVEKVIPGYEKIKLKEATGTFTIADERITTNDLILWGDEASVVYDGYVDFRGNLDFRVENNFVEGLTEKNKKMGRSLSTLLAGMGSFISEARLTGNLKKPKYKFKALPFKNLFKEGFKDILQNILR